MMKAQVFLLVAVMVFGMVHAQRCYSCASYITESDNSAFNSTNTGLPACDENYEESTTDCSLQGGCMEAKFDFEFDVEGEGRVSVSQVTRTCGVAVDACQSATESQLNTKRDVFNAALPDTIRFASGSGDACLCTGNLCNGAPAKQETRKVEADGHSSSPPTVHGQRCYSCASFTTESDNGAFNSMNTGLPACDENLEESTTDCSLQGGCLEAKYDLEFDVEGEGRVSVSQVTRTCGAAVDSCQSATESQLNAQRDLINSALPDTIRFVSGSGDACVCTGNLCNGAPAKQETRKVEADGHSSDKNSSASLEKR